jgi:Flp pilus assembly protein TadB
MVSIVALWLPILLSALFVFIVSSAIHMALGYHANDHRKLPDEDSTLDALRKLNIPPGQYMAPRPSSMKEMKSPEYLEKRKRGPMMILNIWPAAESGMGAPLVQWFIYSIIIGIFAAYVAGRALPEGAPYLSVFRFVGASAFMCYAIGGWQESIWYKRPIAVSLKNTFDGLVYALVTAGTFGWLLPR